VLEKHCIEELHCWYISPDITGLIKSRKLEWTRVWEKRKNAYEGHKRWRKETSQRTLSYHIIHHLFSFCKSVQDTIIHMDMEIVIFVGIKGW